MSNRRFGWIAVLGVALAGLIAGMVFTAKLDVFNQANGQETQVLQASRTVPTEDISGQPLSFDSFRKIAKRMNPTVVNIYTTQIVRGRDPLEDFFGGGQDFFRRFFDQSPDRETRQSSLGSGVIIDPEGYILTNNHVVENADEIRVSLDDRDSGQNGLEATVVGRDPKTDVALIKIVPKTPLVAAALGDSGALQVGDWVIAIGNPFGLGHTVTVGVVSAKGRTLGGNYDDFIQTDASINPGNSGGPLLNLTGEVVGINTAIASRTGQSAGIGFAVPVNLAKEILPQLKTTGRVVRGQLGVSIQTQWNEALARQFGVDHGAVVADVTQGSAADKAGIKRGDVIVKYNGKELRDGSDLPRLVGATKPGTNIKVTVVRDKKQREFTVKVGELEDAEVAQTDQPSERGGEESVELGISVSDLDRQTARQLGLNNQEGVLITRVKLNSAAEDAGLARGDVVLEINRQPVRGMADYRQQVQGAKAGDTLLFLIYRRGGSLFVPVEIPKK